MACLFSQLHIHCGLAPERCEMVMRRVGYVPLQGFAFMSCCVLLVIAVRRGEQFQTQVQEGTFQRALQREARFAERCSFFGFEEQV